MAVSLTPTSDVEKYNVRSVRWAGSQGWIGNQINLTLVMNNRPVRAVQVQLRARNITIPSTATSYAYLQAYINGHWYNFAKCTPLEVAGVGAQAVTLTWLRNTLAQKIIDTDGTLVVYSPFYDSAPATAGLGISASSIRLALMGASLAAADVEVSTPGTNVTKANPCRVTSASHGLTTGDRIFINACDGDANWQTLVNTSIAITKVSDNAFTLDGVDSTLFATCTDFHWGADVTWKEIALDVLY